MTATNHAITGALIGLLVGQPAVAIPAALVSHFVCDAIPHYGNPDPKTLWSSGFKRYLVLDASLCGLLVGFLALYQPKHWILAALCAFIATSPDFYWLRKFIYANKHHRPAPMNKLDSLLGSEGIQWFQRPIGAVVEIAWVIGGLTLLSSIVK